MDWSEYKQRNIEQGALDTEHFKYIKNNDKELDVDLYVSNNKAKTNGI